MTDYPLSSLAPSIDATGISTPTYFDILESLKETFRLIYGPDIYIEPDSQDGQWLAILAKAIDDTNQAAVAIFQAFSPTYAQGAGLSSVVKINGLQRQIATKSTSVGNVVGVIGSIIRNGVVEDDNGNLWDLPTTVTIPIGGSIAVTVTAQELGDITAPNGTINKIRTPQLGWQSFLSTADAIPGTAVETDAELRQRQAISTALPALTIKESIMAAIGNVPGVSRYTVYENDTDATDADGVPAHSIAVVTAGGDSQAIGEVIARRKAPGIQTYGTTTVTTLDRYGLPTIVKYFALDTVPIYFDITITALPGYIAPTGEKLINALVDFINALTIGTNVYQTQAIAAAALIGQPEGQTYWITAFKLGIAPGPTGTADINILFNQAAICQFADVALTVV